MSVYPSVCLFVHLSPKISVTTEPMVFGVGFWLFSWGVNNHRFVTQLVLQFKNGLSVWCYFPQRPGWMDLKNTILPDSPFLARYMSENAVHFSCWKFSSYGPMLAICTMYINYYVQLSTGAKKGFSIQFWLTLQVAFQAPPPFLLKKIFSTNWCVCCTSVQRVLLN